MTADVALLGLAAGDVLGCGYEGMGAAAVARVAGAGPLDPLPGSLYTDDTQQALVLAYHLLDHDGVQPDALADALVVLAGPPGTGGVYRGAGPGFRAFVAHRLEGATVAEAAQPSAGNGAAMRAAPIGIRHSADPARLLDDAVAAGLVTHADARGVAAGAAVAVAVAAGARGEAGRDLVHTAADAAADVEHRLFSDHHDRLGPGEDWHTFSNALRAAAPLVGRPGEEIAGAVGQRASRTSAFGDASGSDAYAPASVVTALVLAADRDGEPVEPVRRAVRLGGDADTMGAITGAVTGARTGTREWPWEIPNDALLLEVGRRLASGERGTAGLPDLYELERVAGA